MNTFAQIRARLGVTQESLAKALEMTQGNVSFYEKREQTVPPDVAGKLIEYAKSIGLELTYDMVYGATPLPSEAKPAPTPKPRSKPTEHAEAN